MDNFLEQCGLWLARVYAGYGLAFLVVPIASYAYVAVLAAMVWEAVSQARGRQASKWLPASGRRWIRLLLELVFGLINPIIYLAILTPSFPWLRSDAAWFVALMTVAWTLLAAFWITRLFGSAVGPQTRSVLLGVRTLLWLAFICLVAYSVKDARLLFLTQNGVPPAERASLMFATIVLRISTLYLIPLLLLWHHLRDAKKLFLLPSRASRLAVAATVVVALVTTASALHRRSDASVRALVGENRELIRAAATEYDVDPRLIGAIVYVTHRDQLAPFRDAIERIIMGAWAADSGDLYGGNQILLNQALDLSVGVAQIKPRTALTASLLATGLTPEDLPRPAVFLYRNAEPLSALWHPGATGKRWDPPFPVPVARQAVVAGLLDARVNLSTCAMILALYQRQWESADTAFNLRSRPEILATLYQIGFARSKPHASPRSNVFGQRVHQVLDDPWLGELFSTRLAGVPAIARAPIDCCSRSTASRTHTRPNAIAGHRRR